MELIVHAPFPLEEVLNLHLSVQCLKVLPLILFMGKQSYDKTLFPFYQQWQRQVERIVFL
jgi:hypothetical protein